MSDYKGTREETKEILSSLDSILKSLNETKSSSKRTNNYNTKHSSSSFQNKTRYRLISRSNTLKCIYISDNYYYYSKLSIVLVVSLSLV